MRRRVWVLVKMMMERHPTWAHYKVWSKRSWQKQAEHQKIYTRGLKHTWVAESQDKAVIEAMKKLLEN